MLKSYFLCELLCHQNWLLIDEQEKIIKMKIDDRTKQDEKKNESFLQIFWNYIISIFNQNYFFLKKISRVI